jgi:hypothetical protein
LRHRASGLELTTDYFERRAGPRIGEWGRETIELSGTAVGCLDVVQS